MIPAPKKTYSRKANQTSSSESSFSFTKHSNNESEKENKGYEARKLKSKTARKNRKDVLEDSFDSNIEGPFDKTEELFEKLLSSPPKVEVNYKPLSFWGEKVKKLDEKNPEKKECKLYEFDDLDESCSPALRKKKVKRKVNVKKKKPGGLNIDLLKLYKKKPKEPVVKTETNKTHEGTLIKEKLLMKKVEEKLGNKEDKFTFQKESALIGITSTPGRDKINIVGASNFSFFSPIQNSEVTPRVTPLDFDVSSIRNEEKNSTVIQATPVIRKSTRLRTKRVSEEDISNFSRTLRNESAVNFSNPFLGFDSGDLKNAVKSEVSKSFSRIEEAEKETVMCKETFNCELNSEKICDFKVNNFSNSCVGLKVHGLENSVKLEGSPECFSGSEEAGIETAVNEKTFNISKHSELILKNEAVPESNSFSNQFLGFDSCDLKNSVDLEKSSLCSSKSQLGGNEIVVDEKLFKSDDSELDVEEEYFSESEEEYKSAESHCSEPEEQFIDLNCEEIGKKVLLLMELYFISEFIYRSSFLSKCKKVNLRNMRMWNSLESVCENDHPYHYSDNEDDSWESVFECKKSFQSSNVDFSKSENKTANSINQSFENQFLNNEEEEEEEEEEKLENANGSNQSFENSFCNVTVRRRYGNFSRMQSTTRKTLDSQNESSSENSLLYKTAVEIEKLEVTLKRLSVSDSMKNSQESSQYLSKLAVEQSINNIKFHKAGNDSSSILESSPEVNNKTVKSIHLFTEENHEKAEDCSQEKQEVFNEEGDEKETKYLSPLMKSSLHTENNLILTPKGCKSPTIDDTFSSPVPLFESTVCEPSNKMLESTARLSSFQNYRKSRVPVRRNVRNSDWNITRISECNEDENENVMPRSVIKSPTALGEAQNFSVNLKTGKKWIRSMSILKQVQNGSILVENELNRTNLKGRNYKSFVKEVLEMQQACFYDSILPDAGLSKTMGNINTRLSNISISGDKSCLFKTALEEEEEDETDCETKTNTSGENTTLVELKKSITARDVVLARCKQEEPLPFGEFFNERTLKNCKKIGEGVYGEVFMYNSDTVIKIIPIEGSDLVNGDRQKKFEEILSEIVIAMELSNLRHGKENRTSGFNELKRCWCVFGEYPQYLIDLWEEFDKIGNGSENDHPAMFKSDQLYIVLELANGGKDLEAFVFNSAEQSLSVFVQTAYILAVAEKGLEFEHRDLHWGNLLISNTEEKNATFVLEGQEHNVPLRGVKVTIIDFTLSRMTYEGCCIFNDLSVDPELFTSQGDYQFEIYRLMQREVGNNWSLFRPKTNVFWLHYLLDKIISMVRYKKTVTKVHKTNIKKLKDLKASMLDYVNSSDFVVNEI